jgi:chemotaxis signal transduction protein
MNLTSSPQHHHAADSLAVLTVQLGERHYAFQIADVVEVAALTTLTTLHDAPPELLGMVNRKGEALPLVDLRRIFGHPIGGLDSTSLFVVIRAPQRDAPQTDGLLGVLIDEVIGVEYFPPHSLNIRVATPSVHGIIGASDRLISVIAANHLVEQYVNRYARSTS